MPTAFLGRLSSDAFGQQLAAILRADGVSLELASVGPEPTTIAVAEVDEEGLADYTFRVEGTSAPNLAPETIPARLGSAVKALHLGTLGLLLEPMATTLVGLLARERAGRLVMLDPNVRPAAAPGNGYRARLDGVISASTIVKASDSDLAWLYPGLGHEAAVERALAAGPSMVVVTLGSRGAFAAHRDLRVAVEAPHVQVVDTIGAGDAFGAGLLAWLSDHGAMRQDLRLDRDELVAALEFASLVAAITCSRAGADPPWRREMHSAAR